MSNPSLDDLKQIEEVVDRFESAWRHGERPRLEEFVAGFPDRLCAVLVRQLVPVEIELRRRQGERTSDEEFRRRLPDYVEAIGDVLGLPSADTGRTATTAPLDEGGGRPSPRGCWPRLPGYLVLEMVGSGAMGVVYKAWQVRLGRTVALKVIAPEMPKARFRREARLIAQIQSSHVVSVHDYIECEDGRGLLVMDFVDGFDLRMAMKRQGGRLAEDVALPMMRQVCEGMIAAAEVGIVHRDLKPANTSDRP